MITRVLVALHHESDVELLGHAEEIARRHNALVELVCGMPRVSFTVAFADMSRTRLREELREWAVGVLDTAQARLASDVGVRMRLVDGNAVVSLLGEEGRCPSDLLVMRAPCWRARRMLRRTTCNLLVVGRRTPERGPE